MNNFESRVEKANNFFNMCQGLPNDQFEIVFQYKEEMISLSSKTNPNSEECGK